MNDRSMNARPRSLAVVAGCLTTALLCVARPAVAGGLCTQSSCSEDAPQPSGALHRVCMPEPGCWNGDLVLFAHGYVAFNEPVAIPEDQLTLPNGTTLPRIVNALGFGFATSSYPVNGLAIRPGVTDMRDLVDTFTAQEGPPGRVYLTGASEGGIVTALALEQFPEVFSGGLAACGPVGDFRRQMDYWGDLRAVFDYFFPELIPGSAVDIPDEVIENWDSFYAPRVLDALRASPGARDELLAVTRAPFDPAAPATKEETILDVLWYNIFATNDGIDKLGGQPFDNRDRFYTGSTDDLLLNQGVRRYEADPAALLEIAASYETSGRLASPVVTLHTTKDPIVPYWHEPRYRLKTLLSGSGLLHLNLPVARYGHCEFKVPEVLAAFGLLVLKVRGQEPSGLRELLPEPLLSPPPGGGRRLGPVPGRIASGVESGAVPFQRVAPDGGK